MKRLFVLIVVLMLASCGGTTDSPSSEPAKESAPVKQTFDSLQAAMDSGLGMKCTFNYEGETGEVLVKGEKYSTTIKSEGQLAHSISDGTNMYVWADGQKEGIMVTPQELKEAGGESQYGVFDQDQKVDFTCLPHVVSGASFQPPGDVKFITITELMESMFS